MPTLALEKELILSAKIMDGQRDKYTFTNIPFLQFFVRTLRLMSDFIEIWILYRNFRTFPKNIQMRLHLRNDS